MYCIFLPHFSIKTTSLPGEVSVFVYNVAAIESQNVCALTNSSNNSDVEIISFVISAIFIMHSCIEMSSILHGNL